MQRDDSNKNATANEIENVVDDVVTGGRTIWETRKSLKSRRSRIDLESPAPLHRNVPGSRWQPDIGLTCSFSDAPALRHVT